MDWTSVNLWTLLAGLGFFLFGMELLENSLKNLAGRTFRDFLKRNTQTAPRAIFSGALVTAILQSSTLVSLMTLAFVGAGLLQMGSAIGVILGTNLGTTATGWIFALLGFKLNIQGTAYAMLGIGALARLLTSEESEQSWNRLIHQLAQFLLGFSLLFIGLENMKEAISELAQQFDLATYEHWPTISFALIGFLLTAIIQSSSATMAITLSALNSQLINLPAATGIIIGAYLGTTLTVLLGSIGGSSDKKRVAIAHFLFNLTTATVALMILPLIIYLIQDVIGVKDNLIALVSFHSSISILGIIIFLPFISKFANLLQQFIPDKTESYGRYISGLTPTIHGPALEALEKELSEFFHRVLWFNLSTLKVKNSRKMAQSKKIEGRFQMNYNYAAVKSHSAEIYDFAYRLLEAPAIREQEIHRIQELMATTRFLLGSAKSLKNIAHNIEELYQSDEESLKKVLQSWTKDFELYFQQMSELLEDSQFDLGEVQKFRAKIETLETEVLQCEAKWNEIFQSNYQGRSIRKSEIPTVFNISREVQQSLANFLHAIKLWLPEITENRVEDLSIDDHPHIA